MPVDDEKLPGSHGVHAAAAADAPNVPLRGVRAGDASAGAAAPESARVGCARGHPHLGHAMHSVALFAPVRGWYVPLGQFVQRSAPALSAYVPFGQRPHDAAPGEAPAVPRAHARHWLACVPPGNGR